MTARPAPGQGRAMIPAPSPPAVASASAPACVADRAALLRLDRDRFDQDQRGGWRAVEARGGPAGTCDRAAADLIREWRRRHGSRESILYWHEGQLRAQAGQLRAAVRLFGRARKTPREDAGFGWNLYADGSIAFLRRDRAGLERARAALAALPRPPGFDPRGPDGKPRPVAWPLNLNVLDGLRRCWDQPYRAAYACAAPAFRVER